MHLAMSMSVEATPVDDVAAKREPSLLLSLLGSLWRDMEPPAMTNFSPESLDSASTKDPVPTGLSSLAGLLLMMMKDGSTGYAWVEHRVCE